MKVPENTFHQFSSPGGECDPDCRACLALLEAGRRQGLGEAIAWIRDQRQSAEDLWDENRQRWVSLAEALKRALADPVSGRLTTSRKEVRPRMDRWKAEDFPEFAGVLRTCTKCGATKDAFSGFGLRMQRGKAIPIPWCRKCRSDATPRVKRK